VAIKSEAAAILQQQGIELEKTLRTAIKNNILRYIKHFQLAGVVTAA
jgi:hypothetical protein